MGYEPPVAPLSKSSDYTLTALDSNVEFTAAATATLLAASSAIAGRRHLIKNASTATIRTSSAGGNFDNGTTTGPRLGPNESMTFVSNGTVWRTVESHRIQLLSSDTLPSPAVSGSNNAEVTVLSSSTTALVIPANLSAVGDRYELQFFEFWLNNGSAASTNRLRAYLGSSAVIDNTSASVANSAVGFRGIYGFSRMEVLTIGASGTVKAVGVMLGDSGFANTKLEAASVSSMDGLTTAITIDTTANMAINVTQAVSVSNAANTTQLHWARLLRFPA